MLFYLSLTVLVILTPKGLAQPDDDSDKGCPVTSTDSVHVYQHKGICYQFHPEIRGYPMSKAECINEGGREVIIRDNDTQSFIQHKLTDALHVKGRVWLGLTDIQQEGKYVWDDGTVATWLNWAPNEPTYITGPIEDCVTMNLDLNGQWEDQRCEDFLFLQASYPFICEYDKNGASTTSP